MTTDFECLRRRMIGRRRAFRTDRQHIAAIGLAARGRVKGAVA